MSERSILFITADEPAAAPIEAALRQSPEQFSLTRAETLFDGLRAIQESAFDVLLVDLSLPDEKGLGTLQHLQEHAARTPVIVLCHAPERDTAVKAVRRGAHDFFCYEDFIPENLLRSVESVAGTAPAGGAGTGAERRNNARFPCRLAVSYQTLEAPVLSGQGTSETLNISSKGLLFTSNDKFQAGQLVQVSLDWPARLENQIPLKLVAEGRIVRNSGGQTAMTIDKYEFRTRRNGPTGAGKPEAQQRQAEGEKADGRTPPAEGRGNGTGRPVN